MLDCTYEALSSNQHLLLVKSRPERDTAYAGMHVSE